LDSQDDAPTKAGPLLTLEDLKRHEVRQKGWISPWSRWTDSTWYFADVARAGREYAAANWDFEIHIDGRRFLEPEFEELRETSKIVIYCLHRFPSLRHSLKAQTVNEIAIGLRYFVRWMVASGRTRLDQIDDDALAEFEDFLIEDKTNADLDEALSSSSIARYARGPFLFWEERARLEAAGYPTMPGLPWPGETHHSVGNRLAKAALGQIWPIPKEILVPLLNRAEWFLEGPASDIIEITKFLAAELPAARASAGENRATQASLGRYLVSKVKFSTFDGSEPWHGPLTDEHERVGAKTLTLKKESSVELARDLAQDVMGAASMMLQGSAGLRVSEIEMLQAGGLDEKTDLPDCVEVKVDDTSTIELFYLKGFLVKTTKVREHAEWLIGARVVGANHVPPPVLALQRVYELSRILGSRETGGRLFIGSAGGPWNYLIGNSKPLDGGQIQALQRAFAATWVDYALLDRTDVLRTHGWRKSFAQFIFNADPNLGPALTQHYKHLSMAMTMEFYVTNDPALLGYLDSERAMETARDLYEISTGRVAAAGRLGGLITDHLAQIKEIAKDKDREAVIAALYTYVGQNQIHFWFLEWGNCGIALAPQQAACHREAGTTSWRNLTPNFGYRDLDVCIGCSRLLVLKRHLPFWEERYARLRKAWDNMDADLSPAFKAAIHKKVLQSKAMIRALSDGASQGAGPIKGHAP
jgi:hypothetical protein